MKQTVEPIDITYITYNEFRPYYERVPSYKSKQLSEFLSLSKASILFQRPKIAEYRFRQLKDFLANIELEKFSRIINNNIIDTFQQQYFLKELNNLINSIDFKLLHNKEKSRIVEEQKRLYNQLNLHN